jgi:chromosome segregation ATPase
LQDLSDERQSDRSHLEAELERFQAEESQRTKRLTVINRLLASEAKWTSTVVATTDDLAIQRMAIAALAYDIHPHGAFASPHQQFRQLESQRLEESLATAKKGLLAAEAAASVNSEPIKPLLAAVAETKAEQKDLQSQLKSHLRQLLADEDPEDAPEQVSDPKLVALESQLAEVQQRLDDCNAKLTAAAMLVTEAEDSASQFSQELGSIAARQATIAEIDPGLGLNRQYDWLKLPVCIPGGTAWAWSYFILTILHTTHLAYLWIAVFLTLVSSQTSSGRLSKTVQIVRNWHSMVVVWVILFVLIYLI